MAKHHMKLTAPSVCHINSALYGSGPSAREFENEEIDKMLSMNDIGPAQSEWSSSIVFAPRKDGWLRYCIYYRKWSSVTFKDGNPIPRVDDRFDPLGETGIILTIDAKLWVLASLNQRPGQGRNDVYVVSRTVQICKNAVRSEECTNHVTTRDGYYFVNLHVAVCARIRRQCHHPFWGLRKNIWTTYKYCWDSYQEVMCNWNWRNDSSMRTVLTAQVM